MKKTITESEKLQILGLFTLATQAQTTIDSSINALARLLEADDREVNLISDALFSYGDAIKDGLPRLLHHFTIVSDESTSYGLADLEKARVFWSMLLTQDKSNLLEYTWPQQNIKIDYSVFIAWTAASREQSRKIFFENPVFFAAMQSIIDEVKDNPEYQNMSW
jgi:hypothetical protein